MKLYRCRSCRVYGVSAVTFGSQDPPIKIWCGFCKIEVNGDDVQAIEEHFEPF